MPRSRVVRRTTQRNSLASRFNFNEDGQAGVMYARQAGRRREDYIVPLGIAFGLFLCVSLVILGTLITQNFKPAKAQTLNISNEPEPQAAALPPGIKGQVKILLLGSDQRPEDNGYRTDVIILMVLNPEELTVSAFSFPRDLWVDVPGMYAMKINQVHGLGGFPATAKMFESNFGVKPDYYLLTNFEGFTKFIDNRGGIDVEVGQELTDDCDLPQARDGDCTVVPGVVQMDGATALWYVRSRNTSNDFDRLRRAQEVVYAVGKKMLRFKTVGQFAKMKDELGDNIETNLSPQKAVSLLPLAARLLESPDRVRRFAIGEEHAQPSWSSNGMWILLPDLDAIQSLLREAGVKK
jgi:polyisoprenyl-teichoic acid--peptidoglycan teichoic acid transferase